MAEISVSKRLRRTPFSAGVEAAGVQAYTVYNHMLLATAFEGVEEDYHHLKRAVQVWDVACQRQVELLGPDAIKLLQILTPRDLSKFSASRCMYIPMVDQNGGMLNDPVAVLAGENRVWVSIADSDAGLWIRGIAAACHFDVQVFEPDVSPLAVQGPQSLELMSRVFGPKVADLKFFGCGRFDWEGTSFVISRSGFSKQLGYEIYVEGSHHAMPLWSYLMDKGQDLDVRAGCPNGIERIEGGLLSYGNDMTEADTPLSCGLSAYVSDNQLEACFGGRALREEREAGSPRKIAPVAISGRTPRCDRVWRATVNGTFAGEVTSAAWSPDFEETVAIAMIDRAFWAPGTRLTIETQDGPKQGTIREKFWI